MAFSCHFCCSLSLCAIFDVVLHSIRVSKLLTFLQNIHTYHEPPCTIPNTTDHETKQPIHESTIPVKHTKNRSNPFLFSLLLHFPRSNLHPHLFHTNDTNHPTAQPKKNAHPLHQRRDLFPSLSPSIFPKQRREFGDCKWCRG